MGSELPPLRGEAVADEVQLDGSRHLTIEAADDGRDVVATLHLIVDREQEVSEAEVTVTGPGGSWSAVLVETVEFEAGGALRLRGLFRGPEDEAIVVEAVEGEAGWYDVVVARD